jgi:hypothetical protein
VARPGDFLAGLGALQRNVWDGAHHCLDFVRSSSGPAPGGPG